MVIRTTSRTIQTLACLVFSCTIVGSSQLQRNDQPSESLRKESFLLSEELNIVGGSPVTAAYGFYVHDVDGTLCGGTLIHPDIVLTAAHCKGMRTFVYIGSTQLFGGDAREKINIAYTTPHPNYTPGPELNDIMLVKLASPSSSPLVTLNVDPTLPSIGQTVRAIGFGHTSENSGNSDVLLQVDLPVYDNQACVKALSNVNPRKQLCAGLTQGGKDTCSGDSGGPLLDATTLVQYGVVSYGNGCALAGYPGVYTRVSAYADWIQQYICENSDSPPSSCKIIGFPASGKLKVPCNGNINNFVVRFLASDSGQVPSVTVEGVDIGVVVTIVNDASSTTATINWSPPVSAAKVPLVFRSTTNGVDFTTNNLLLSYVGSCTAARINAGSGWFLSPVNSSSKNTAAAGRAEIQFMARYKAAKRVLVGNLNFKFELGLIDFTSTSYDWLRITSKPRCAKLQGSGTLKDDGNAYKFTLTICDVSKSSPSNTIRFQIWKPSERSMIYDTLPGSDDASYTGTLFNYPKRMITRWRLIA